VDELQSISIVELLNAVKKKRIPVQSEIGAFIALETCEAIADRTIAVTSRDVWIDQQGRVSVKADKQRTSSEEAARAITDLLCELLLASAQGITALLLEVVDDATRVAPRTLVQLRDQLEASLVPLNRSASQRVVARLVREALREGDRSSIGPPAVPNLVELDSQFDELFSEESALQKKNGSGGASR
jgi:hypothetical protein